MAISGYSIAKSQLLNQIGTAFNLTTASNITLESKTTFESGTIEFIYATTLEILVAYPHSIDLMSLLDPMGALFAFNTIRHVHLKNKGAGTITVGGGTRPIFTALPPLQSGGVLLIDNEFDVEDGVADILRISVTGYSATVDIILAGE